MRIADPKDPARVIHRNDPEFKRRRKLRDYPYADNGMHKFRADELNDEDLLILANQEPLYYKIAGRSLTEELIAPDDVDEVTDRLASETATDDEYAAGYNGPLAPYIEALFAPYMGWSAPDLPR
jgi:hypothetical protein